MCIYIYMQIQSILSSKIQKNIYNKYGYNMETYKYVFWEIMCLNKNTIHKIMKTQNLNTSKNDENIQSEYELNEK